MVRRAHDIGMPGWMTVVPPVLSVLGEVVVFPAMEESPLHGVMSFLVDILFRLVPGCLGLYIWLSISFRASEQRANEYGDVPNQIGE